LIAGLRAPIIGLRGIGVWHFEPPFSGLIVAGKRSCAKLD
jgi:hypothetical protein